MSYIALARQWRPRTFSQLVGQDHVSKPLIHSLNQQRLHHAYLFTGTRGVGKTSVARLLAKAFNCEKGISAEPCLTCDACQAIEQGRFIDLLEIDGASKTRVEDIRELLDNVQYTPVSGRFKIYLIDEVHMLSQHSFNALLKTLEEPPSHVKFLLATTDPQKLPITVLSRCLQFNLKPIAQTIIVEQMQLILNHESIAYDQPALSLLATAAQGSMRDALSLLDQAIASCDNKLNEQSIKTMLGYTQQDYVVSLLESLVTLNAHQLITISQSIALEGGQFHHVLNEMIQALHDIHLYQSLKSTPTSHPQNAIDDLFSIQPVLKPFAQHLSREDVQLFYHIALKGLEELSLAPIPQIGFDMVLLRMHAFRPANIETPPLAYQTRTSTASDVTLSKDASEEVSEVSIEKTSLEPSVENKAEQQSHESPKLLVNQPNATSESNWKDLLSKLNLTGLTLTAAEQAEWVSKEKHHIQLKSETRYQSIFTSPVVTRMEQALSQLFQENITLSIEFTEHVSSPAKQKKAAQEKQRDEAEAALHADPLFHKLQQEFSAELDKSSITSLEDSL